MRLFHITPGANINSIAAQGISPEKSRGARKECWYVTRSKVAWAVHHVHIRHGVQVEKIVAIEVHLHRFDVTRRRRGVYTCSKRVALTPFNGYDVHEYMDLFGPEASYDGAA